MGRRMALLIVPSKTIQEDSCTDTQQEGLRLRFGSYGKKKKEEDLVVIFHISS